MADLSGAGIAAQSAHPGGASLLNRLAAAPWFQALVIRLPFIGRHVRAEGARIFDIMAGFVNAQALAAIVELRLLHHLADGPLAPEAIGMRIGLDARRAALLAQAAAALGLVRRRRDGRFALATRGAAFLGVPGLEAMVRHHHVLYADLARPVALLRGETEPALARFWPYVFGAAGATDPADAALYSDLMAQTQAIVAADTLAAVDLRGARTILDVGGGTGAFLAAVGRAYPDLALALFDLPAVLAGAEARLAGAGMGGRVRLHPGSFRDDPLPTGADVLSLVRVLYDHADDTVSALLRAARAALPAGGRIIISEPMSGGARPDRATDVYFAFYTLAMGTGRTRSAAEIARHLEAAGFVGIEAPAPRRAFVTSVVTARVPGA
jgi:demethylspheroidene O-methyltransferase